MPEVDWFAIQENTFTRWCNDQLAERGRHIEDLKSGLKDGIALIHIIEVCSEKKIAKYNMHPKIEIQKVENLTIAFEFMKKQNVKIVNISAEDIITGNVRLMLGLVWTLIQEYDIGADGCDGLLRWVQSKIPDSNIVGWKKDWNDGRALNALIDAVCPGLMPDHANLEPSNAVANCRTGIELAHTKLGVDPRVLAEEMAHPKVDKNAMQTYIAQFRNVSAETIRKALASDRPAFHELASAYGPGVTEGVAGETSDVMVEVPLECNDPLSVVAECGGVRVEASGQTRDPVTGLYQCRYTPQQAGAWSVHVTLGGRHVGSSPFAVPVLARESLGGEGKIRVFFSTTQVAGKGRADVRNLEHLLQHKKVHLRSDFEPWHAIDLMEREDREAVFRRAGTRALPIVFVDDEYVGDYDALLELEEAGRLDAVLGMRGEGGGGGGLLTMTEHLNRLSVTPGHTPEKTGHAPEKTGHAPEKAGHAPEKTGHAPEKAGHAPEKTGHAPEKAGHAPEQSGVCLDLQVEEEEEFTDIPMGALDGLQEIDGLQD